MVDGGADAASLLRYAWSLPISTAWPCAACRSSSTSRRTRPRRRRTRRRSRPARWRGCGSSWPAARSCSSSSLPTTRTGSARPPGSRRGAGPPRPPPGRCRLPGGAAGAGGARLVAERAALARHLVPVRAPVGVRPAAGAPRLRRRDRRPAPRRCPRRGRGPARRAAVRPVPPVGPPRRPNRQRAERPRRHLERGRWGRARRPGSDDGAAVSRRGRAPGVRPRGDRHPPGWHRAWSRAAWRCCTVSPSSTWRRATRKTCGSWRARAPWSATGSRRRSAVSTSPASTWRRRARGSSRSCASGPGCVGARGQERAARDRSAGGPGGGSTNPSPFRVVAGDFNTPVESHIFRDHWSGFRDCHSAAGWGFGFTKRTRRIGTRIDHVLAGRGLACVSASVGDRQGGDHGPVVVDIRAGLRGLRLPALPLAGAGGPAGAGTPADTEAEERESERERGQRDLPRREPHAVHGPTPPGGRADRQQADGRGERQQDRPPRPAPRQEQVREDRAHSAGTRWSQMKTPARIDCRTRSARASPPPRQPRHNPGSRLAAPRPTSHGQPTTLRRRRTSPAPPPGPAALARARARPRGHRAPSARAPSRPACPPCRGWLVESEKATKEESEAKRAGWPACRKDRSSP